MQRDETAPQLVRAQLAAGKCFAAKERFIHAGSLPAYTDKRRERNAPAISGALFALALRSRPLGEKPLCRDDRLTG